MQKFDAKIVPCAVFLIAVSCLPTSVGHAFEQLSAGEISLVRGSVTMTLPYKPPFTVNEHDKVFREAVLATGGDSISKIDFNDETQLTLGRDSFAEIKEFVPPEYGSRSALAIKLVKGYFRLTPGLIAKENPSGVTVEVPYGTIAIQDSIASVMIDDDLRTIIIMGCRAVGSCTGIDVTAQGRTVRLDTHAFYTEILPNQQPSDPRPADHRIGSAEAEGFSAEPGLCGPSSSVP
jgi:hypothetical protein